MKRIKLLAAVMAVLMACAVLPLASMAEGISVQAHESYMLGLFDQVWAHLEAVEAEALEAGASAEEVTMAVYRAALVDELVDAGSVTDLGSDKFAFRVSGMLGGYNYESRNVEFRTNLNEQVVKDIVETGTRNGATSVGVLLVGPYYGYDSNFTNQYRNEAQSLADYTEGNLVKLEGHGATGPAIAAAAVNAGTIIYDSHGTAMSGTSYLCLTTNSGLTSTDFSNGWAYNGGSNDAGIDGRYIQNHIEGELPNNLFWMAICEGMKLSGHGVTGTALLAAGAGVVYGYSQSVTFAGDYIYEATFWNHMKNGETVAEAFAAMVAAHGVRDPYGDAYPIVMSADDPFPANPDSAQTVHSDWQLYRQSDLVVTDATSLSFEQPSYGIAPTFTEKIIPVIAPEGANNFTSVWSSSNTNVAVVNNKGVVTGVAAGTATITLTITSTEHSNTSYSYTASVPVIVSNEYLPVEQMYVPTDIIVPGETYLIGCINGGNAVIMSNEYYSTSNQRNLKAYSFSLTEVGGKTCLVEGITPGMEWTFSTAEGGMVYNAATGMYLNLTGNYLTIGEQGIDWHWAANENGTGVLSNTASATHKFLGASSTYKYFGVFLTAGNVQLFRKLTRTPAQPMQGDVTGDGHVDANDALALLRYSLGIITLSDAQLAVSDIDGNGNVDANDALMLLRMALGLA